MIMEFVIESVNISESKGVQKHPVEMITLRTGHGIEGDAHAGNWHRQVSFLAGEAVDRMKTVLKEGGSDLVLDHGAFAENIVTRGVDWKTTRPGDRIQVNEVLLEITQIGKECHSGCAISLAAGDCIMPKEGIFAKVLHNGEIRAGDKGEYIPTPTQEDCQ